MTASAPRPNRPYALGLSLALCSAVATGPSIAQTSSDEPGIAGRMLAETIFDAMDVNDRGSIHLAEIDSFNGSVFAGMDYDENRRISLDEFSQWDPGFQPIAEELGRGEAYVTAQKIMFAFWDRDGSGELNEAEMDYATRADFRRADANDDGLMTKDEFFEGYPVVIAMRATIRPDL
ncbi:MAG: EF-hand domain-containing protein [Pseudomonadota bacterium]